MRTTAPHELLPALAQLGGFFVLHDAHGTDAVPWADALADAPLRERCATVRAALATATEQPDEAVDPRVAVSAVQVGLASRLWSVAVAGAVGHGWVPDLSSANLLTSPGHRGPVPLALVDPSAGYAVDPADPRAAAEVIGAVVVRGSLADLDAACGRVGRTSTQVFASNAASSLVGAARVLSARAPGTSAAAWALARTLLLDPEVAHGGQVRDRRELPVGIGGQLDVPDEAFMRRGCCLYDRLPEHGLCPDCVRAERRPELVTPGH